MRLLDGLPGVPLEDVVTDAALMTRVDRKYLLVAGRHDGLLETLVEDVLAPHGAHLLEMDGRRAFRYESTYLDTPDHEGFRGAAHRRRRRVKVRGRPYVDNAAQAHFDALVGDFWIDAHRAAKLIRRGDLWRAMTASQCHMRSRLLTALEWHARAVSGQAVDTWYGGRFIESWLHPRARQFLPLIHARYEADDMARALLVHVDLFRWVTHETARQLELSPPEDEKIYTWIQDTLHALAR